MGAVVVVVVPPGLDQLAGMARVREQALVAQSLVEALDEAVLHWLSWRDVMPFHFAVLLPFQDRIAGQLRAARHRPRTDGGPMARSLTTMQG